jgi:hypothetical protein
MDVPLEVIDREVCRARAKLGAARASLARAESADGEDQPLGWEDAPNPLAPHRRVATRATWLELGDAAGAAPLRAWVYALTLDRVLWPDEARVAAAWQRPSIALEERGVRATIASPRDLLLAVLREPSTERRRIFASALAEGAAPVQDAARIYAERRAEAARLLDPHAQGPVEIPIATEEGNDRGAAFAAAASRLLADTRALVDPAPAWSAALAAAVGRAHAEGWPARLGPRWLFDLFHAGPLTEGLMLALPPLPAPFGAASFARTLGAFGGSLADAAAPRIPFSTSRPPFDARRHRRAGLFASLAADPVFGVRALGLGRGRARDQARGVARAMLVTLRLDAARVLLRGALEVPPREGGARFEEHTAAALGVPIPASLLGVVPRLGPEDAVRFAGSLVAATDRRALIDRYDEDWFRSPHAARAIREEDALPFSSTAPITSAALEAGVSEIVRALGDLA